MYIWHSDAIRSAQISYNLEVVVDLQKSIFLDVGGHRGQTLHEVSKPVYHFDQIHCFEPLPSNCDVIRRGFSSVKNLNLHEFGLSDQTKSLPVFERTEGDLGATVKRKGEANSGIETSCEFVKASDFFRENISVNDIVIVKLNCEGSECDILNDLIDSGEIFKIRNVMIDFDVRKFENLAKDEDRLLARLKQVGFKNYSLASNVMFGKTHPRRIENWLSSLPYREHFRQEQTTGERVDYWLDKAISSGKKAIKKLRSRS